MKINYNIKLPNDINLVVVEADELLVEDRYQVVVRKNNKSFISKNIFGESKIISDLYTPEIIELMYEIFPFTKLCYKSIEDCNTEVLEYMAMYNQGIKFEKDLIKIKF